MTATDAGAHAEGQLTPEPPVDTEHDWAQYAAVNFDAQKRAGVAVTMDVAIASEIAATFETRDLRYDVQDLRKDTRTLTAAIKRLEKVFADHTATMKAFLAATQQQGGRFAVEEAEDAQRAVEEGSG